MPPTPHAPGASPDGPSMPQNAAETLHCVAKEGPAGESGALLEQGLDILCRLLLREYLDRNGPLQQNNKNG